MDLLITFIGIEGVGLPNMTEFKLPFLLLDVGPEVG